MGAQRILSDSAHRREVAPTGAQLVDFPGAPGQSAVGLC